MLSVLLELWIYIALGSILLLSLWIWITVLLAWLEDLVLFLHIWVETGMPVSFSCVHGNVCVREA